MSRLSFVTAGLMALATLAGGAVGTAAQQSAPRIAYINSERILQANPEVQQARESLGAEMQQYREEVQEMARDLEQMIQQYEQRQLTMSAEAKEAREAEIRAKQQEYQQRVQQLDQQAAQRQSEVVQPIMERINQVIEALRAEQNYAIIFDTSAGAIIAADPALEITDEVIDRMNQASESADGSGS